METNMTIFDHLYALTIAVIVPVAGYITFNKMVRRAAAGEVIDLMQLYNSTIVTQWALFGMLIFGWDQAGRQWSALGFSLAMDFRLLIGLVLTVLAILFLVQQLRQLGSTNSESMHRLRGQLGKLEFIFPRTESELSRFSAVSVTAGIAEETIWRGFMIWYLAQMMPVWAAALVSTIGFGLAHAYQGASNVPKVILVGAAFTALYLLTGSLWLPMVLHAIFDIVQGRAAFGIIRSVAPAAESQSP